MKYRVSLLLSFVASIGISAIVATATQAATVILRPNGDPPSSVWNYYSPDTSLWSVINKTGTGTPWICANAVAGNTEYFDMTTANIGQGATGVSVSAHAASDYLFFNFSPPDLSLGVQINGSDVGTERWEPGSSGNAGTINCSRTNPNNWSPTSKTTTTWTGNWNQAAIDGLKVRVQRIMDSSRSMGISQLYATVTYDAIPDLVNVGTRVFNNANSVTPGSLIADYTTVANLPSKGANFRLRMNVYNGGPDKWRANFGTMKLQYAKKGVAECNTITSWTDVSATSGDIRWYDNPGVADSANIAVLSGDTLTSDIIPQTYRESNNFTIRSEVVAGKYAQFDFSLKETAAVPGATYCFKIAKQAQLNDIDFSYEPYLGIVKSVGSLDGDIVDASGNSVTSPTIQFGLMSMAGVCQQSSATLGTSAQKLYVSNGSAVNGWSMTLAPTGGPTATWASTGGDNYDFNDPTAAGCSDGADADSYAGQLSIKPSTGTVTPMSGCSGTGISKGPNAAFSQGTVDAITLFSATASADMYCGWSLTGVTLNQTIPAQTKMGTYALDMTLTTVAS